MGQILELQRDVATGNKTFELVRCSLGDQTPIAENAYGVGQFVRLVEVLGGEEDRDTRRREVTNYRPHFVAASRVQAGGGFVEKDDVRFRDEAHRDVESSDHAARIVARSLVAEVRQAELVEKVVGTSSRPPPAQVIQLAQESQVLGAGQQCVDGRVLPGDADASADVLWIVRERMPRDRDLAGIEGDEGRENSYGRGLSGAVRAEEGVYRSGRDGQIESVQYLLIAVSLTESADRDCGDRS